MISPIKSIFNKTALLKSEPLSINQWFTLNRYQYYLCKLARLNTKTRPSSRNPIKRFS